MGGVCMGESVSGEWPTLGEGPALGEWPALGEESQERAFRMIRQQ